MSIKARTPSLSKSLKAGISPTEGCQVDQRSSAVDKPLTILQKIQAAMNDISKSSLLVDNAGVGQCDKLPRHVILLLSCNIPHFLKHFGARLSC